MYINSILFKNQIFIIKFFIIFCIVFYFTIFHVAAQGLSINVTDSLPHTSAILDISSDSSGVLIPRVELTGFYDTLTITSPTKGLLVFNINEATLNAGFYFWDGSLWQQISIQGSAWSTEGNSGTNPNKNFLGTTDNQSLIFKTNNLSRMIIMPTGKVGFGVTNPSAQLSVNQSFSLQNTSDSSTGVIYLDTIRFLHNYKDVNANSEQNIFFGSYSGNFSITSTAVNNIGIGQETFSNLTSGKENIGVGTLALKSIKSGNQNNAFGYSALYSDTSGNYNNAFGNNALYANSSGSKNAALGDSALRYNTTGQFNTASGAYALYYNDTNNFNTAVGYRAFYNTGSYLNSTAIGYNSAISDSNQIVLGNSVSSIGGYVSWSDLSDGRFKNNINEDVPGLDFIKRLRPVTFKWKMNEIVSFFNEDIKKDANGVISHLQPPSEIVEARNQKANKKYTGFIAQEVKEAANDIGYDFNGVKVPNSNKDAYTLSYSLFVVSLTKAIKEQQQTIALLKNEVEQLKATNEIIKNKIDLIQNK